ncbi:MAG: helix-turn-helix domain-containing protein, partial [Actinomycetota bacterium]|nr:helix-turn-helix domain-containing protein [Actinomycetota bacterium]
MEVKMATRDRDWMTVKQAADELGKVPTHVYRLAQQGCVGFQHEPFGVMKVRRQDVERLKTERETEKLA